ncbi:MAG: hypothetical protein LR015_01380 [Verrucomicrobia bacterium]|nr:hypothetical protein [Verrucomicrobiota bacterium]
MRLAELKKRPINAWIRKHRPDVILGMGPKTLDVLNRFGYQVPQDFSYVGLELPFRDTNIAGIHCNHELVAEAAVDLVINQINANERGLAEFPKTVTIDGYWQDGSTMPGKEL